MAKTHRDIVAAYCIDLVKKADKPFTPLVLAYWSNEDKVVCDLTDFPYPLDGSQHSEDFYVALGCVGGFIGERMPTRDDLTYLYMAIECTNSTSGKPVLALLELDITEGTQIQRGYDISPEKRKSLSAESFFEERSIISPRLACIAAALYGIQGTLEKNKHKILPFLSASWSFFPV